MAIRCQNCNEAPATVHITDIVPPHGEKRERHLCERCAESEGVTMKQHETFNTVLAKFVGLIGYIVLGIFALKLGATPHIRIVAFVGALAIFAYIVGVALAKSPASWLKLMAG